MIATIDIGTLITREPDIRQGRPIIAGTGVTVQRIVIWYKMGLAPEEIAARVGVRHVTVAQVFAALTYYQANREEIERDIADDEAAAIAAEQADRAKREHSA